MYWNKANKQAYPAQDNRKYTFFFGGGERQGRQGVGVGGLKGGWLRKQNTWEENLNPGGLEEQQYCFQRTRKLSLEMCFFYGRGKEIKNLIFSVPWSLKFILQSLPL